MAYSGGGDSAAVLQDIHLDDITAAKRQQRNGSPQQLGPSRLRQWRDAGGGSSMDGPVSQTQQLPRPPNGLRSPARTPTARRQWCPGPVVVAEEAESAPEEGPGGGPRTCAREAVVLPQYPSAAAAAAEVESTQTLAEAPEIEQGPLSPARMCVAALSPLQQQREAAMLAPRRALSARPLRPQGPGGPLPDSVDRPASAQAASGPGEPDAPRRQGPLMSAAAAAAAVQNAAALPDGAQLLLCPPYRQWQQAADTAAGEGAAPAPAAGLPDAARTEMNPATGLPLMPCDTAAARHTEGQSDGQGPAAAAAAATAVEPAVAVPAKVGGDGDGAVVGHGRALGLASRRLPGGRSKSASVPPGRPRSRPQSPVPAQLPEAVQDAVVARGGEWADVIEGGMWKCDSPATLAMASNRAAAAPGSESAWGTPSSLQGTPQDTPDSSQTAGRSQLLR